MFEPAFANYFKEYLDSYTSEKMLIYSKGSLLSSETVCSEGIIEQAHYTFPNQYGLSIIRYPKIYNYEVQFSYKGEKCTGKVLDDVLEVTGYKKNKGAIFVLEDEIFNIFCKTMKMPERKDF